MQLLQLFKRAAPAPAKVEPTAGKRDLAMALRPRNGTALSAARTDNTTMAWDSTPRNPDDLLKDLRVAVARSRNQCINNDYAKSFLRKCVQNIVGESGVVLQARVRDASGALQEPINDALEAEFAAWGEAGNCDVTGMLSWLDVQETQINHAAQDGEFFLQFVYGEDAGPYGFAVRLIDPQRCPPDLNIDNLPGGKFVRGGIEFNRFGRPLRYAFSFEQRNGSYAYTAASLEWVPADQVVHGFLRSDRIGLRRGIPWTNTALQRLYHLAGYDEAALVNVRVSASKMGFIEYDEGHGPELDEDDELHVEVAPGVVQELPEGAHYKESSHAYPAGEHASFTKGQLRAASSGLGVPYEELSNDRESVNYSSIRQGQLDSREHWKQLQGWFIRALVSVVYERWLAYALLAQKVKVNGRPLRIERLADYKKVAWQGRRWTWIDPKNEVEADVIAKNNGLKSPGQIIREQGKDPKTVWLETAADIQSMKDAGLPDWFIQQTMGFKAQGGQSAPGGGAQGVATQINN